MPAAVNGNNCQLPTSHTTVDSAAVTRAQSKQRNSQERSEASDMSDCALHCALVLHSIRVVATAATNTSCARRTDTGTYPFALGEGCNCAVFVILLLIARWPHNLRIDFSAEK